MRTCQPCAGACRGGPCYGRSRSGWGEGGQRESWPGLRFEHRVMHETLAASADLQVFPETPEVSSSRE